MERVAKESPGWRIILPGLLSLFRPYGAFPVASGLEHLAR